MNLFSSLAFDTCTHHKILVSCKQHQQESMVLKRLNDYIKYSHAMVSQRHLMRNLSKNESHNLLKEAGVMFELPPEQGLAIKADLVLPWKKLRIIQRLVHPGITDTIYYNVHTCS